MFIPFGIRLRRTRFNVSAMQIHQFQTGDKEPGQADIWTQWRVPQLSPRRPEFVCFLNLKVLSGTNGSGYLEGLNEIREVHDRTLVYDDRG